MQMPLLNITMFYDSAAEVELNRILACHRVVAIDDQLVADGPRCAGRCILRGGVGQQDEHRVNRGGSWINDARNVRAAYRNANAPGNRNSNLGFRLVRAQQRAGWPTPDPPRHPTAARRGENPAAAGVLVARGDTRASVRRRLFCHPSREEGSGG